MVMPLTFKDNASAFEYACKFMNTDLFRGVMLPAIVLDAREFSKTELPVKKESDGTQLAILKVCSDDGGFMVAAKTIGTKGPDLKPGDFVAWQAGAYSEELGQASTDNRFGWVGFIIGKLKTEWVDGSWVGGERFT